MSLSSTVSALLHQYYGALVYNLWHFCVTSDTNQQVTSPRTSMTQKPLTAHSILRTPQLKMSNHRISKVMTRLMAHGILYRVNIQGKG